MRTKKEIRELLEEIKGDIESIKTSLCRTNDMDTLYSLRLSLEFVKGKKSALYIILDEEITYEEIQDMGGE